MPSSDRGDLLSYAAVGCAISLGGGSLLVTTCFMAWGGGNRLVPSVIGTLALVLGPCLFIGRLLYLERPSRASSEIDWRDIGPEPASSPASSAGATDADEPESDGKG